MAGMFYSLKEVAGKLNKSEEEITQLVKEGKLREFRDGPNLLFKVDEVEALMAESNVLALEDTAVETQPETMDDEILLASETSVEPTISEESSVEPTISEEIGEGTVISEEAGTDEIADEEELSIIEEPDKEASEPVKTEPPQEEPAGLTDFALDELTGADTTKGGTAELAGDTAASEEGISILGDTDNEYKLTDDTASETQVSSEEESLKEIEDDVNLDTFGSGSGLLDLSLQADDTSLGGILDEIYAPGEEAAKPGSAMDMASQTEHMLAEASHAGVEAPALMPMYIEPEPDTISNAFGIMLFIPFLAIIYTGIVSIAGFNGIMPVILKPIEGIIWYIMGGALVLSLLIIGIAFMTSGQSAGKPKVKKEKKAKPKKQKKPKKEKGKK